MTGARAHTVRLSGDAGLRNAYQVAEMLRVALKQQSSVLVSTDAVTAADITTIQLLLAARRLALASGRALDLAAAPAGPLRALLIQIGILDATGRALTPDGDFWTPNTSAEGKAA